MKRKPKPATAGERIAWDSTDPIGLTDLRTSSDEFAATARSVARRIDAAIRSAVRKERERCGQIVLTAHISRGSRWDAYQKIRAGADE